MNAKTKIAAACAAMLVSSLLFVSPTFAQTPQPPTPPPAPTIVAVPVTPRQITEDDRRILRGDQTISGDNFTLRSNETLQGDLTVLGGNVTIEAGAIVEGQLNIVGGNADVAGTVAKDVNLVGGTIALRSSADVQGDVIKLGGTIRRDEGATVGGRVTSMNVPFGNVGEQNNQPEVIYRDRANGLFDRVFSIFTSAVATFFGIVLITLIALGFAALLPNNLVKAAAVAVGQWGVSGVVGALTLIAVPIIAVVLSITICLIPVAFILLLAYGIAVLAGWVVSARIVGERLMAALNRTGWTLIAQVVTGAILLALLGAIPFVGGLVAFAAVSFGLGALILTRLGTQNYPPPTRMAYAPASPDAYTSTESQLVAPVEPAATSADEPPTQQPQQPPLV